jgi:hypothetical protein
VVCSVPKSGTHLMIGILESLFGETSVYKPPGYYNTINSQIDGNSKTESKISENVERRKYVTEKEFRHIPNLENKVYVGHIPYSDTTYTRIKDIPKILLVRDPRDYLVSMFHYLNQSPDPKHAKFRELSTQDAKMSATIFGMRDEFYGVKFYGVNELYDKYFIKWIGSPKLTIIRFEDIIGSEFGGEDDKVISTFQTIISLIQPRLNFDGETIRNKIRVGSDPTKSDTFRPSKRKIGVWKEELTEDHVIQFKLASPFLVSALGYENDENWSISSSALEYSQLNERSLYPFISENKDYASITKRYERLMEDIVFSSPYFRELDELVNDWALRQLLELKANITATLTAQDEVPPKSTIAKGAFELELSADGGISNYILNVTNISDVTLARMHLGARGTNGPIVMTLYQNTNPGGQINGILSKGKIFGNKFEGPLAGKYISDLMNRIQEEKIYINVCTNQNPEGEIRGQLSYVAIKNLKYHHFSECLLNP